MNTWKIVDVITSIKDINGVPVEIHDIEHSNKKVEFILSYSNTCSIDRRDIQKTFGKFNVDVKVDKFDIFDTSESPSFGLWNTMCAEIVLK